MAEEQQQPIQTPTAEEIRELLKGFDRYNPSNLPLFESYVQHQVATNTCDMEANLATLKLYQFNPQCAQRDIIVLILIKGVMSLPSPDVNLCFSLLSTDMLENEHVKQITYLSQLLETCHFREFWSELPGSSIVFNHTQVLGFDDAIRKYIISVLSISYQQIQRQLLRDFLNLQEGELDAMIKANGWVDKPNGLVSLETNLEADLKPRSIVEKIDYEYMSRVIGNAL
eukprot:comp11465_c0_seq1/m.5906 comp11465_c0_seq1/g.5906  ORF comp11465_c0_seq1/g.5906 comp11465_c0_seq1/m.5906 type:complete len:227 (-) comp11465_c0_seq1:465-1145(-)